MDDNTTPAVSAAVVLNGGTTMTALHRDGTAEDVLVRVVPLSKVVQYASKIDNVCELIELVCDKPPGWADGLLPESAFALDDEARRLNDPTMARVAKRQQQVAGRIVEMSKGLAALTKSLPTQ